MSTSVSSVTKITLTKGKYALVDSEDLEKLSKYKWHYNLRGYAVTNPGTRKEKELILMHRLINNTPVGMQTDHINGNKLDNRKENLRTATSMQNIWNKPKQSNNTSGYKGVSKVKSSGKWEMQIRAGKQRISRRFKTKEEAALAYNKYALELHGEFACLNKIGAL